MPPSMPAPKPKKKMRVKKLAELPPAHRAVRDGDAEALATALEVSHMLRFCFALFRFVLFCFVVVRFVLFCSALRARKQLCRARDVVCVCQLLFFPTWLMMGVVSGVFLLHRRTARL